MNYEFTKLGAVEALTEMPENANALVEVNGAIKRVPASAASGGGSASAGAVSSSTCRSIPMEGMLLPTQPTQK